MLVYLYKILWHGRKEPWCGNKSLFYWFCGVLCVVDFPASQSLTILHSTTTTAWLAVYSKLSSKVCGASTFPSYSFSRFPMSDSIPISLLCLTVYIPSAQCLLVIKYSTYSSSLLSFHFSVHLISFLRTLLIYRCKGLNAPVHVR